MKKFDIKSLVAGIIIGTLGITTVNAATGIQSAVLNNTKLMLNGISLPLDKSLISVTMDDEKDVILYAPVNELFEKLGYTVNFNNEKNMVDVIPGDNSSYEVSGNIVMSLTNNIDQTNIAESGSFQAENNQILTLDITSDIKGGTVDLFLFSPNGKEQRITIGSTNITKDIVLEKGIWQYNCSGVFKDGGNVKIVGAIKGNVK
ncbi:MAG: hypothetical protein PHV18_02565 [Lachnospiraceae bacterium]|nr:hypothetical protein [Lachnospiraceae bacterium]